MNPYMQAAIEEANKGIAARDGGPFGAVIVRNGEIIARGHNEVVSSHDPTAHAEIVALRRASRDRETFDLSDCEIYSTCEPCPMCYAAIHWAKIKSLTYGATREDAARIGFDDAFLYAILEGTAEDDGFVKIQADRESCLEAFEAFENDSEKTLY